MPNCRIVVLISGNGSNLQAIIDKCHLQDGAEIVAVVSNRSDAYGLQRARAANIAAKVLDHKAFESRESYDKALITLINEFQADLLVMAGFMRILTPEFVTNFSGKMLNIHPSLLPKYQGLHTHQRAIEAGDKEHGASVHFVTEELDGGPVILQARVPVFAEDTVDELAARVHEQEHQIYPMVVTWFACGRLSMGDGQAILDGNILPPDGYAND
ncbi:MULTISPECIES: phosphoribosylglycinamide formyltransferase [Corallincola]|uniref:Phosphoribosylglycinamide formyltransferase n=2 Tax=Corallincola TaxID=1775176 RepID=A0A368NIQ1_9GAMM|nr:MULTISPECIES: phosphoribosylglycinamide formyltransferase [Corallincola]RCU50328.1 phosphoribosylglycinamide formyltransferase [Corallincola holothuriorum]TAA48660.1 phosphoribosylglycinamide formyltransferase [Corallincola spongiicola]